MAKETRTVKHYKIFKLNVSVLNKNKSWDIIPVAIFDDIVLGNRFVEAAQEVTPKENATLIPSWVEIAPAKENYNLPFNPVFDLEVYKSAIMLEKPAKRLKHTPKVVGKQPTKPVSKGNVPKAVKDMVGIKIGRKGGAGRQ